MIVAVTALLRKPQNPEVRVVQILLTDMVDKDQAKGRMTSYLEENFPDETLDGTMLVSSAESGGVDPTLVRAYFEAKDTMPQADVDIAEKALREAVCQ